MNSKWEKTKKAIKPFLTWKMLISFGIAWLIFAGWSVAFIVIGAIGNNAWFYGTGIAFLTWVLIPNGTFMIPFGMSLFIHKLIFGKKPIMESKGEIK